MVEVKFEHEDFDCPKTGTGVRIKREARVDIHLDQADLARFPRQFVDCDSKKKCGVGTLSGSRWNFDWTKCVAHPDFKV